MDWNFLARSNLYILEIVILLKNMIDLAFASRQLYLGYLHAWISIEILSNIFLQKLTAYKMKID